MQYARHGHSCCTLGENLIFVSGSRKDIDGASKQTEMYNTETNTWVTLAPLNTARHYHSSCSFQRAAVYVFCGISNETKKYLNTIERLRVNPDDISFTQTQRWETLAIQGAQLLQPRQGCGVCEV